MAFFWRIFHHDCKTTPSLVGGGGGAPHPHPFNLSTITSKVVGYAPAERADRLSLFLLYPYMYYVATAAGIQAEL
jgi:hypothetical protein